jgi:hypothetical protein
MSEKHEKRPLVATPTFKLLGRQLNGLLSLKKEARAAGFRKPSAL